MNDLSFPRWRTPVPLRTRLAVGVALAAACSLLLLFHLLGMTPAALLPAAVVLVLAVLFWGGLATVTWPVLKQLLVRHPLLMVLAFVVVRLIWGLSATEYGVFYLFWHDRFWAALAAGFGIGLLWFIAAGVGYLLVTRAELARVAADGTLTGAERAAREAELAGKPRRDRIFRWLLGPALVLSLCPLLYYQPVAAEAARPTTAAAPEAPFARVRAQRELAPAE
jgi:hypothetical protein